MQLIIRAGLIFETHSLGGVYSMAEQLSHSEVQHVGSMFFPPKLCNHLHFPLHARAQPHRFVKPCCVSLSFRSSITSFDSQKAARWTLRSLSSLIARSRTNSAGIARPTLLHSQVCPTPRHFLTYGCASEQPTAWMHNHWPSGNRYP
jgi:hypothetical protein